MSKYLKPGSSYYTEFCTQRFDTGQASNADSLPVATVNKNGVDDGSSPSGWNSGIAVTGIATGRYVVTGTVPTGYNPGDIISINIDAVVNSVTGSAVIDEFCIVSANVYDSLFNTGDYLKVDLEQAGGTGVIPATGIDSNIVSWNGQNVVSGAIPFYQAGASGGLAIVDASGYTKADVWALEGDPTPIDSKTLAAALRYIAAVLAGLINDAGTGTETFKGLDGITNRIQFLVDESGNRTGITYDP